MNDSEASSFQSSSNHVTIVLSSNLDHISTVLTSSVEVQLQDQTGVAHNCRALLDSESQSKFITSSLASKLEFFKKNTNISVVGIAHVSSNVSLLF